jgi:hypothetical protein
MAVSTVLVGGNLLQHGAHSKRLRLELLLRVEMMSLALAGPEALVPAHLECMFTGPRQRQLKVQPRGRKKKPDRINQAGFVDC